MKTNQTIRSFRSQVGRRCYQIFLRNAIGRKVRVLTFTDYTPCANGGTERTYFKLLTHDRHPIGCNLPKNSAKFYAEKIIPVLQPGVWVEVVFQ
ncbi:hypothetical protein LHU53_15660 [Rhodoferax sp. U2-2l]|uniref:hypothetical protein n=1 Tax=Rhodoferax sp. U2-2l TaxID=2884000 RepID=UPI001D0B7097|nr:hypothetical protein [Rhodoferax sp. U2-2l]MCB8748337.1 hypothetical protein [Rhodoferax sp. U2-2l]